MKKVLVEHKIPKISVIVPIYNSEKHLEECLISIAKQTLREIEIILIDSESTDNSLSICQKFAENDKRIRIYTQKNIGVGPIRNKGISLAKGEYISFVDSNDYYSSDNSLELLYLAAVLNNVDICAGKFSELIADGVVYQNFQYVNSKGLFKKSGIIHYKDYQFFYGFHHFIYKRDFLVQNGLHLPDYQYFDDYVFLVQVLYKANYFYVLDRSIYVYRKEHKKIYWTKQRVSNFLSAIFDIVCFAQKYGLKKLSYLSYIYLKEILVHINLSDYLDHDSYNTLLCLKKMNPFFSLFDDILKTVPPKVSVVIPIYNVEKYLDEALQSVVNQTLKDIEIICVNDGSTDSSLKILQSYQKKDDRIKIIDKKNTGYGDSMNIGIEAARGEYIAILEPDDYIEKDMYKSLYERGKKFNLDYIKSDYYVFFEVDGKRKQQYSYAIVKAYDYNRVINPQEEMYTICMGDVHTWTGLYKRRFLLDNKITHNITPGASYQDSGFFIKTMCCAKRIMFVRKPFYMYRIDNPAQSIKGDKFRIFHEHFLNKKWLESFFTEKKYLYAWAYRIIHSCFWVLDTTEGKDREKKKKKVHKILKKVMQDERIRSEVRKNFIPYKWKRVEELLKEEPSRSDVFLGSCIGWMKVFCRLFFSLEDDKDRQDKQIIRILGIPFYMDRMHFYSCLYRKLEPKIVFSNFWGNGYGCNPKYIAEEIIKRKLPYKLVWLVKDETENNLPNNIVPVLMNTHRAFKELVTAKVWVDNQRKEYLLQKGIYKREGQFYIQTWHGSLGIKRLYNDMPLKVPKLVRELAQKDSDMIDCLLTCSTWENSFIGRSLWYNNEIKSYGHPRDDVFFKTKEEQEKIRRKVCDALSINFEDNIILYAPSWRDNHVYGWALLDIERLLSTFQKKWPGQNYTLLIRLHPLQERGLSEIFHFRNSKVLNASEYSDIQELLVAADYMISDYSSCIFDYVITHKPGFIFAPDRHRYETMRGFYYPLEETPFPIAKNNYEMEQNILNFDMRKYIKKVDIFLRRRGWSEDGHASERVVDLIENIMEKK